MSAMASEITGVSIICPSVCSGAEQRKLQYSASLAFVESGFPRTKTSNVEKVSILWRHHDLPHKDTELLLHFASYYPVSFPDLISLKAPTWSCKE